MVTHRAAGTILLLAVAGALALYLAGAASERRSRRGWSGWRTGSFVAGAVFLGVAVSPPVSAVAHHDLRVHVAQHLLAGMFAPLGLVLGAPLTLALRTLPLRASRFLSAVLRTPPFHWLSHPITALVLNMGGTGLLYLTPLYSLLTADPVLHSLMHLHVLLAGALFAWAIAGPDPAPRRPPLRTRLIALFLSAAAHATLARLMYIYLLPAGVASSPDEVRAAAQLMYYGGDLAELLLAAGFFAGWYQHAGSLHARQARLRRSRRAPIAGSLLQSRPGEQPHSARGEAVAPYRIPTLPIERGGTNDR